ncbi:MAG: GNAT family N-acetyltransferase [Chloroflexota bacterium]
MSDGAPGSAPRRPATARPRDPDVTGSEPPSRQELEAIESNQMAFAMAAGAEVAEDPELGVSLMSHADSGPQFNRAVRVRWPSGEVAQRLAEIETRMRSADRWPSVVVSEGLTEPANLAELLGSADWRRLTTERIMFTRHAPVVPHLDPGLRIEAVTPATVLECARLEVANFGMPPTDVGERAERLATAVAAGGMRAFIVRLLREPVASARLVPGDRVAGLGGIGVAASQRRRGYGRLITAVATRAGLATGHGLVWLSVDAANTAAVELYRSLGYEPSFAWSRWAAPADSVAASSSTFG